MDEELSHKASLGDKAARLLENPDLKEFIDAYDAMLSDQEELLAPMDKDKFMIIRAGRRILGEFIGTFMPGVQAEGEMARAEQQGLAPDKRIIL